MDVLVRSLVFTILIVVGIAAVIGVSFGVSYGGIWLIENLGVIWACVILATLIFVVVLIVNYFND
jgi:hypothetical protein